MPKSPKPNTQVYTKIANIPVKHPPLPPRNKQNVISTHSRKDQRNK
jgi:hypothetical protein